MRVAGVDGCRGGWAVASVGLGGALSVVVAPTFADVLGLGFDVVGVDMPIGLDGVRACDVAARRELGPRRSSVFPAPWRDALGASTWAEAAQVRGLSRQAFGLFPKVREVDALMTPALQGRVFEVHPEFSFCVMSGAPMAFPKRTADGRAERLAALAGAFGPGAAPPVRPVRGAAGDDVLDACAVLWSAQRAARGEARRLGDGSVDARGLRMEIVV